MSFEQILKEYIDSVTEIHRTNATLTSENAKMKETLSSLDGALQKGIPNYTTRIAALEKKAAELLRKE